MSDNQIEDGGLKRVKALVMLQGTVAEAGATYPAGDWSRLDPAEAGFDPAALEALAAEAEAGKSNCLVVTRLGRLVAEWYWNGTDASTRQEAFSVTKSVTSTLVGIAQADGALDGRGGGRPRGSRGAGGDQGRHQSRQRGASSSRAHVRQPS